jgi:hypothetical protein
MSHFIQSYQKVTKAIENSAVDAEIGIEIESKVKKAIIQSEKNESDKQNILENINGAKVLIEGVTSAAGLVIGLTQVAEMIRKLL